MAALLLPYRGCPLVWIYQVEEGAPAASVTPRTTKTPSLLHWVWLGVTVIGALFPLLGHTRKEAALVTAWPWPNLGEGREDEGGAPPCGCLHPCVVSQPDPSLGLLHPPHPHPHPHCWSTSCWPRQGLFPVLVANREEEEAGLQPTLSFLNRAALVFLLWS